MTNNSKEYDLIEYYVKSFAYSFTIPIIYIILQPLYQTLTDMGHVPSLSMWGFKELLKSFALTIYLIAYSPLIAFIKLSLNRKITSKEWKLYSIHEIILCPLIFIIFFHHLLFLLIYFITLCASIIMGYVNNYPNSTPPTISPQNTTPTGKSPKIKHKNLILNDITFLFGVYFIITQILSFTQIPGIANLILAILVIKFLYFPQKLIYNFQNKYQNISYYIRALGYLSIFLFVFNPLLTLFIIKNHTYATANTNILNTNIFILITLLIAYIKNKIKP